MLSFRLGSKMIVRSDNFDYKIKTKNITQITTCKTYSLKMTSQISQNPVRHVASLYFQWHRYSKSRQQAADPKREKRSCVQEAVMCLVSGRMYRKQLRVQVAVM